MTKPIPLEQRLASARQSLSAAENKVAELDKMEADAINGPEPYATWLADRGAMLTEAGRLRKLVQKLEIDFERQVGDDARAAVARRRAALEKTSAELARKIREDGGRAAAILRSLAIEAAKNEAEIEELNGLLPQDVDPLLSADFRARWREPAPRKVIEEKLIYMWAFEETGELVGAQDEVVEISPDRGFLRGAQRGIAVIRRQYRQIRYFPPGDREHVEPLYAALRLPRFDSPGSLWNGDRARSSQQVAELLQQSPEPLPRRELVELVPVPVVSSTAA